MTARLRIGSTAVAAAAALALTGNAFAAFTPRFVATGSSQAVGGRGVKLKLTVPQTADPTAKATVLVPSGYRVAATGRPGVQLGTIAATLFSIDLNAVVPVTGTVEIANAADFTAQATACTGTTGHAAYWAIRVSVSGLPLVIPVFVDSPPAALGAVASAQLVLCFGPPDVPAGTPGRSTLGTKLLNLELTTSAILNPPARGEYRWRALATPYTPATGIVNTAASAEVQSLVTLPSELTLKSTVLRSAKKGVVNVTFSGLLLSNLKGVARATVQLLRGATAAGLKAYRSLRTDDTGAVSGAFLTKQDRTATTLFLFATTTTAEQNLGVTACTATFVPPVSPVAIPCLGASVGSVTVSSPVLRVNVPAAPPTKKKR